MYWVIDEQGLAYTEFANGDDMVAYLGQHRNAALMSNFVHLIFAGDSVAGVSGGGGLTRAISNDRELNGSVVFIDKIKSVSDRAGFGFSNYLVYVASHELTHQLIDPPVRADVWDRFEHELDPDEDLVVNGPGDRIFLMKSPPNIQNTAKVQFSNVTRREIDLSGGFGLVRPR
jgi:hypothetical protein